MIAQIVVYIGSDKTKFKNEWLIKVFDSMGFHVMVDAVHDHEQYFKEFYKDTHHRVFYLDPLLYGKIEDVKWDVIGMPDFGVWFKEPPETDDWDSLLEYIKAVLSSVQTDKDTIDRAKKFIGTHVSAPMLKSSAHPETGGDLIVRDENDGYFVNWKKLNDNSEVWSVKKPHVKDPFSVVIKDNSGPRKFFMDLIGCPDFGEDVMDIQFLKMIWGELCDGEFDIDEFTKDFKDCDQVLRNTIDEIEKSKKF